MTDILTRGSQVTDLGTFRWGDDVIVSADGTDYTGKVYGQHRMDGGTAVTSLWVASEDMPVNDYPYAYRQPYPTDYDTYTWPESGDWQNLPGSWFGRGSTFYRPEPEPMVSEEVTRLQAEVSDLRSQVDTAKAVIAQIGRALVATAEVMEWCGEYDRRANDLAESLPSRYGFDDTFREAAIRSREYEVCVHWTETRTYSTTVTVEAASTESAVDMVMDSPDSYVDRSDHYPDDTEVSWDDVHSD